MRNRTGTSPFRRQQKTTPDTARAAIKVVECAHAGMTARQTAIAIRVFMGVTLTEGQVRYTRKKAGFRSLAHANGARGEAARRNLWRGHPKPTTGLKGKSGLAQWLSEEDV
jgi:hypothetical protein